MITVKPVKDVNWDDLDRLEDRTLFQTLPWLDFISETQKARPVILRLESMGRTAGYFSGFVVRKFGFKILGSPFKGWTTESLGFNLASGVSPIEALDAVASFAFTRLGCRHLELLTRRLCQKIWAAHPMPCFGPSPLWLT
ncbi:MAG: hypothetical protein A4E57_01078 [Syntrophorhabdaceae bacterium PtaU1.Bin034]|nr:MAG: hypothetical protein A4E57_01078 [Syntrophorhabdaceae bacterium PtaU1.Bin034]